MEMLWGMAAPNGPGTPAGRTGRPAQTAVGAYGVPLGDGRPQRPGPLVGGTGSPALAAVGAYGRSVGDGSSQRPKTTSWGDGESCPLGGQAYGGRARDANSQTAGAHRLGGRGLLHRQRSVPMEGLRVRAVPSGADPPAKGTRSPARVAVSAYGGPARERRAGDASS